MCFFLDLCYILQKLRVNNWKILGCFWKKELYLSSVIPWARRPPSHWPCGFGLDGEHPALRGRSRLPAVPAAVLVPLLLPLRVPARDALPRLRRTRRRCRRRDGAHEEHGGVTTDRGGHRHRRREGSRKSLPEAHGENCAGLHPHRAPKRGPRRRSEASALPEDHPRAPPEVQELYLSNGMDPYSMLSTCTTCRKAAPPLLYEIPLSK